MAGFGRRAAQFKARIGDQRHPGFGGIGHRGALAQRGQKPLLHRRPAVIVQRQHPPAIQRHAVDLQQPPQAAGVFGRQQIGRGQHIQRPQGDVAGSADRRADKIQPRRQTNLLEIQLWTRPV